MESVSIDPQLKARIIAHFSSDDPGEVRAAVQAAREAVDPDFVVPLLAMMKTADNGFRREVVQSLFIVTRTLFLRNFSDLDGSQRKLISKLLLKFDKNIIDKLMDDFRDLAEDAQLQVIEKLKLLGTHEKTKKELRRILRHSGNKVRATAVRVLGVVGDMDEVNTIRDMLSDDDSRVRANAIEALEAVGISASAHLMMRFLGDDNNRVRANAIKAYYNLANKDVREYLAEMLQDRNLRMRASAVWVIGELGEPAYLDLLAAMTDDTDANVRRNVALAYGKHTLTKETLPMVRKLAADKNGTVSDQAKEIISRTAAAE